MSGFRYLLWAVDGTELGEFVTAVPTWNVGDEFEMAGRRRLRILSITPYLEDEGPYAAEWTVESIDG